MSVPDGADTFYVDTYCGVGAYTDNNGGAFDHIIIPDGQCNSPAGGIVVADNFEVDRYCGIALLCSTVAKGLNAAPTAALQTVCSMNRPFKISIETDDLEYVFPAAAGEGAASLVNARGFGIGRFAFNVIKRKTVLTNVYIPGYFMQTTCLTRPNNT